MVSLFSLSLLAVLTIVADAKSFCDPPGPGGPGTSCGDWDDARTTRTNVLALKAFFQRFPALQARDLYLSGESYVSVCTTFLRQCHERTTAHAHIVPRICFSFPDLLHRLVRSEGHRL